MRDMDYRKVILKRIDYYEETTRHYRTLHRLFETMGIVLIALMFLGYSLYTDSTLGLNDIPMETCLLFTVTGGVTGAVFLAFSLAMKSDADNCQRKLNRILRRKAQWTS